VVVSDRASDEREMISAGDICSRTTTGSDDPPDEQATVNTTPMAVIKPTQSGEYLRVRAVTHETTCGAPQLAVQIQHLGTTTITDVDQWEGSW